MGYAEFETMNKLLPPATNTCLNTDVSRHILVSRYIIVKTCISGRREYVKVAIHCVCGEWSFQCESNLPQFLPEYHPPSVSLFDSKRTLASRNCFDLIQIKLF
jgi:hypothetical protein